MTQQDIVNELNRMVVGYNINWDMIKNDADRAIMKINAHLGAEYPMMSTVMLSPNHRYAVELTVTELTDENVCIERKRVTPIFPEKYILTVVIPFIASEILARDEEFTTIYNKYVVDTENGLFEMFQNEFNKVPSVFRQDSDIGVFFTSDMPEHHNKKHHDKKLPDFKFNVYYHFNNEYTPIKQFTIDTNRYAYGSTVVLKSPTIDLFINDIYAYKFKCWSTDPEGIDPTHNYNDGEFVENIRSDLHLYAQWEKICVLSNDNGRISIINEYKEHISTLNIPKYIDGQLVSVISSNFDKDTNLIYCKLPRTNLTIETSAFTSKTLKELIFPFYDYIRDYPTKGTIASNAIVGTSISHLYIPISITSIDWHGIVGVPLIECEYEARPSGFRFHGTTGEDTWTNLDTTDNINLPVIKWGIPNG